MQVPQAAPLIGWSRLSEFHNSTTGHNNPTKSLNIVPAFTDQFVVTTVNPPITFTASTVSDWEKYTSIGIYTDVASTKVYSGGLVWEPIVPNGASSPTVTVPVNVIPTAAHMSLNSQDTTEAQHSSKAITTPRAVSTAGATLGKSWNIGPTIVATATTGNYPVVTFSASRDASQSSVTSKTTESGTTIFPGGWIWAPVKPPGVQLPPILPSLPENIGPPGSDSSSSDHSGGGGGDDKNSEGDGDGGGGGDNGDGGENETSNDGEDKGGNENSEESSRSTSEQSSTSTSEECSKKTATVTFTEEVSYTMDASSITVSTTTSTITPSLPATPKSCVVTVSETTTTTHSPPETTFMADEFSEHFMEPDVLPPPDGGTQKYLANLFRQLGYAAEDDDLSTTLSTSQTPSATSASSTAAEPLQTCGGTTYAEAIPNAVGFVKGLTSAFCNDRGQNNNAKDAFRKEYSASDAKVSSKRSYLFGRSPPPPTLTPGLYSGWKVQFEWKPGNLTSADCTSNDACSKTLGGTLTRCQGYDLNSAYKSGNYSNECGTYSYSISGYPEPSQSSSSAATSAAATGKQTTTSAPKPSSSSDPTTCGILPDRWYEDGPVAYARNIFQTAKYSYCFNGVEHVAQYDRDDGSRATYYIDRNKMDPFIHLPALCQGEPTDKAWVQLSKSQCDKVWDKTTRATVRVQVSRSPDQTGCESLKDYKVPQGRECDAIFDRLIDKCMPMDSEIKSGVTKVSTSSGCYDYWLIGVDVE